MNDVIAFVHAHLDADAALSIAALGEPDDDAYLAVEARAKSFHGPGTAPWEGRQATPGGRMQRPVIDATGEVRPAALFAVAEAGPGAWVALVGDSRDLDAMFIANALLIEQTDDGPRITGRAAIDPFTDDIEFEPTDGETVPATPTGQVNVLREPASERHAAFLRGWAG